MEYKVFYTDVPTPAGWSPDFSRLMPFVFPTREIALDKAFVLRDAGAIVWRIDGPDVSLNREDVEREHRRRKLGFR
jgi:hypothetical protein